MVTDAQAHAEEDRKRREEIEAKNRLDSLVYASEKTFNENKAKLDAAQASAFESALADAKKALEAGGASGMNEATERLQQASHKLAETMYRTAGQGQPSGSQQAGGPEASPAGAAREDEVIDTEYVESDKR
jgi:molecular chaperone DnaK